MCSSGFYEFMNFLRRVNIAQMPFVRVDTLLEHIRIRPVFQHFPVIVAFHKEHIRIFGSLMGIIWNLPGVCHKEDLPAMVLYYIEGTSRTVMVRPERTDFEIIDLDALTMMECPYGLDVYLLLPDYALTHGKGYIGKIDRDCQLSLCGSDPFAVVGMKMCQEQGPHRLDRDIMGIQTLGKTSVCKPLVDDNGIPAIIESIAVTATSRRKHKKMNQTNPPLYLYDFRQERDNSQQTKWKKETNGY